MNDQPDDPPHPKPHGTIEEPGQATVDDWFGQNAARDADLADELVEEEGGDEVAAERRSAATKSPPSGASTRRPRARTSSGPATSGPARRSPRVTHDFPERGWAVRQPDT